jgi:hypothetical protein
MLFKLPPFDFLPCAGLFIAQTPGALRDDATGPGLVGRERPFLRCERHRLARARSGIHAEIEVTVGTAEEVPNLPVTARSGALARIHKSAAVNVSQIAALERMPKGDYEARPRSGVRLRLSRRYAAGLLEKSPT